MKAHSLDPDELMEGAKYGVAAPLVELAHDAAVLTY